MPVLAYFGVVGAVLLGLLFVAEAQLGPPSSSLTISTNFYGLPAPYKSASTKVLTVRDAPAPEMAANALARHTPAPVSAAAQPAMSGEAPLKIRVTKASPKPKKAAKQTKPARNMFAGSPSQAHRVW